MTWNKFFDKIKCFKFFNDKGVKNVGTLLEIIPEEIVNKLRGLKDEIKQAEEKRREEEYSNMASERIKEVRKEPFKIIYNE